ncbi:MAG: monovalent cation/H(+) antiporter subunit G [Eubacterium sp.]|nr:monovalent cation/H(+) antiporter subunit G [Eubacterium sp.]
MRIVIDILIVISLFFAFAGTVGIIRMPDEYCRMQSSTNVATLGVVGVIIGGLLYSIIYLGNVNMAVKLAVMGLFYIITNPIAGHAIAKGAYKHGVKACEQTTCDHYGEDMVKE